MRDRITTKNIRNRKGIQKMCFGRKKKRRRKKMETFFWNSILGRVVHHMCKMMAAAIFCNFTNFYIYRNEEKFWFFILFSWFTDFHHYNEFRKKQKILLNFQKHTHIPRIQTVKMKKCQMNKKKILSNVFIVNSFMDFHFLLWRKKFN